MDDMVRRGRDNRVSGGKRKLTETKVAEIKFLALEGILTLRDIGSLYDVSWPYVASIRDGRAYPHVEPKEPPPRTAPPPIGFLRRF